jgi:hypothetical protein
MIFSENRFPLFGIMLGAPRHQDKPGIVGVIDRQHTAERQVADRRGVVFKLRMQRPDGHFDSAKVLETPSQPNVSMDCRIKSGNDDSLQFE